MSVWSRIRWNNVARAVAGIAALLVVIAWPRLAAPPPEVPDGRPVSVGAPPTPALESHTTIGSRMQGGSTERATGPDGLGAPTRDPRNSAARRAGRSLEAAARRGMSDSGRPKVRRRRDAAPRASGRRGERRTTSGARRSGGRRPAHRRRAQVLPVPSPVPSSTPLPVPTGVAAPAPGGVATAPPPSRSEFDFER